MSRSRVAGSPASCPAHDLAPQEATESNPEFQNHIHLSEPETNEK